MERIVIFVFGIGSNVKKIIEYFWVYFNIEVGFVVVNKLDVFVLVMVEELGIEIFCINWLGFY